MRFLIDTHVLIWFLQGDESLSLDKRSLIIDGENDVLVSIASLWGIAIKLSRGKLELTESLSSIAQRMQSEAIETFQIETSHLVRLASLPFHHKDPFDRMIVAQSLDEGLPVITNDSHFADYGVELL